MDTPPQLKHAYEMVGKLYCQLAQLHQAYEQSQSDIQQLQQEKEQVLSLIQEANNKKQ